MSKKYYFQTLLTGLAIVLSSLTLSSGANYCVPIGSGDSGGANRSSTSYRLHDVIGQAVIGNWQSAHHKLAANLYPSLTSAQIILVSPASGTVGIVVSVEGAYFSPTEAIRIDFGNSRTITLCTTDSRGIFATTFTIDNKPQGTQTITATGLSSGSIDEAYFFVILLPIVSASDLPDPFSPDGDTIDDTTTFTLSATHPLGIDSWTLNIYRDAGHTQLVKSYGASGAPPAIVSWDGYDNNNKQVLNGLYHYLFKAWNNIGASNTTTDQTVEVRALLRSGNANATAYNQGKRLVRDSTGKIHLVYHSKGEIYYAASTNNGLNWSGPVNLSNNKAIYSTHPSIAVDSANNAYVVWEEFDNTWQIVYHQVGVGNPEIVSPGDANQYIAPAIAIDSNNVKHLVFEDYTNDKIMSCQKDIGPFSSPTAIGDGAQPCLTIDSHNEIHCAWVMSGEILYRHTLNGNWLPAIDAINVSQTSGNSSAPSIVADSNDDIHILWSDTTLGNAEVFYKKCVKDVVSTSYRNLSHDTNDSYYPSVGVDTNDVIYVVWYDYPGMSSEVLSCNSAEADFGIIQNISQSAPSSGYPNLALKGNVAGADLVWTEGDTAPYEIKYQRLGAVAPVPSVNVRILPPGTVSAVGQQFDVIVQAEAVDNLYSFELYVGYGSSTLKVVSVTKGAFISSDGASSTWFMATSTLGVIHAASTRYGTTTGVNGTGTLIGIRFEVLANIHHSTMTLTSAILKDNTTPVPQTIPVIRFHSVVVIASWDINGDGVVNISDLSIVGIHFGETPASPNWYPPADVNNDGIVNITDLAAVGIHFGESYGSPAPAPALSPARTDTEMKLLAVPQDDTYQPGAIFKVEIKAENAKDLYAYQFDLKFNQEMVSVVDVNEGSFLKQDGVSTFFVMGKIGNGVIKGIGATRLQAQTGVSGDGVLAVIYFKVKEDVISGKATFKIENVILKDNSKPVPQNIPSSLKEEVTEVQITQVIQDLTGVIAYPNPLKAPQTEITFDKLTNNVTTFKIYNLAGELVASLNKAIKYTSPTATWAGINDDEKRVASGVYIYVIIDADGHKKVGKVAIIR
ncbi:MAG: cohesin domain-containing protein [bacterium]